MLRFNALNSVQNKKPLQVAENGKRSELFAINVFNEVAMRQLMTRDAFDAVMNAIQYGTKIDRRVADQVAASMRDWAISKGATHYTHWFQPLTGGTAEKHDAFFEPITRDSAIERFSVISWCNKSPMPLASRMGVSAILLKHEVIRLGILRRRLSYMVRCSVFLLFLSLIQLRHWIIKRRYLKR